MPTRVISPNHFKICPHCTYDPDVGPKPIHISFFWKNPSKRDGHNRLCAECAAESKRFRSFKRLTRRILQRVGPGVLSNRDRIIVERHHVDGTVTREEFYPWEFRAEAVRNGNK